MKHRNITCLLSLISCTLLLQACASQVPVKQSYDFGAMPASGSSVPSSSPSSPAQANFAISLADINAPGSLDSNAMLYRLEYDNAQQARPYSQHRWSMPPAQLLTQRLKARIAEAGGSVVSARDGVGNLPLLQIDLDEFSQVFSSSSASAAQIQIRATVVKGRSLLAQRSFARQIAAPGADAPGGAKAMVIASDAMIADLLAWLHTLPLR
ncbi:PqiC family protein [Undibacterium sp. Jales W-56]|uniref:ABC-type transport auxiliary lipoprotein family protein n=1 Tax=Undibacterium sp. Jales W-56 TaxID=2897325 RepID=UPI0021D05169|nr:PqiC family protein [Undibacterium sp. Jales W-56]MCU6435664.1 PqiC family protein [Undibacterium sp. Jales W-56]